MCAQDIRGPDESTLDHHGSDISPLDLASNLDAAHHGHKSVIKLGFWWLPYSNYSTMDVQDSHYLPTST